MLFRLLSLHLNCHQTPLPHCALSLPQTSSSSNQAVLASRIFLHQSHSISSSGVQEIARIDNNFKEQGIVLQIRLVSLENRMSNKQRTTRCNIHRRRWLRETATRRIWPECVRHMSPVRSLIEQHERHLLLERPPQDVVIVALHHDEKERDVTSFPGAISVEIDSCAHLVSVSTGVERLAVERKRTAVHRFTAPPAILADLPDEDAIVIGSFHALKTKAEFC